MSENIKPMSPLEARALHIARWYALACGCDPSASPPDYLPRTPEAAEAFMPHEWVTVAIMDALIGAPVSHNDSCGADVSHNSNVPTGYVLVPLEPTPAMLKAGDQMTWVKPSKDCWKAMVQAAAQPSANEVSSPTSTPPLTFTQVQKEAGRLIGVYHDAVYCYAFCQESQPELEKLRLAKEAAHFGLLSFLSEHLGAPTPLSDTTIERLMEQSYDNKIRQNASMRHLARAVEAAHGIRREE